ncbi:MAG: ribosome recycling factor [Lewinellaceae bacterium]|nr:ribosome recycling factor [Phaeodactylibacter sp.]MCB9037419.1 ribosome recycling factor [Lewinellaceae bacterium]
MQDDVNDYIEEAKIAMEDSIEHLQKELATIRAGKASPNMLSGIIVPYYGTPTPLNQVANVSASDSKTITIQPWEKSMLAPIEKAIFEANLGVTPQNNGEIVIINIPALTEERRKELVKRSKGIGEDTKVGIRNARRDAMDGIKKEVKAGYPEDAGKRKEDEVEKMTKEFVDKVDKLIEGKEKDIMTI